jgi:signal transduction histidine kinase
MSEGLYVLVQNIICQMFDHTYALLYKKTCNFIAFAFTGIKISTKHKRVFIQKQKMIINLIHNFLFVVYLSLAVYVMYKEPKRAFHQSVFGLLICASLLSLSLSILHYPDTTKETADLTAAFNFVIIGLLGIFIFLSLGFYTKILKPAFWLFLALGIYFIGFLSLQVFGDFSSVQYKDKMGLWVIEYRNNTVFYVLNTIYNGLIVAGFIMLIIYTRRKANYVKRKQAYILLTTGIFSFVSSMIYVMLRNLFPEWGLPMAEDILSSAFLFGLIYSIFNRYDIFETTPFLILREIIKTIPTGLVISDEDNKVIKVNDEALSLSKKSEQYFKGKQIQTVMSEILAVEYRDEDYYYGTTKVIRNQSDTVNVNFYFKKVRDARNLLMGSILLINDIELLIFTQNKLKDLNLSLEKKVHERTTALEKAKERAEESDRLKTAFLRNISHEVRTPLNAISGFSDIILQTKISEEKKKKYARLVDFSTKKLIAIIENIITIAHIETNQLKVEKKSVLLHGLNRELYTEYKSRFGETQSKKVDFEYTWQACENTVISTDYTLLQQILRILLDNAFKFTEMGFVKLRCNVADSKATFVVEDSGIGIPEEKQKIILKSFTQADESISQLFGGVGLGLAIAKGLVKLLGGELKLYSQTGKGTKAIFAIPLK